MLDYFVKLTKNTLQDRNFIYTMKHVINGRSKENIFDIDSKILVAISIPNL